MATSALQIVGLVLGAIGLVLTCAVTGMPQWKVTAYIDNNIITFEGLWEGLWMACVRQINIRMQCKIYDSLLALPSDLQAGRALMCVAVALAGIAFAAAILGMSCTRFIGDDERTKGWVLLVSGIVFIMSGIAVLIPVSWTANTIIRDFYNPLVNSAQKRELGDALFIGWTTALILVAAGVILCLSCPRRDEGYRYKLPPPRATPYSPPHGIITRNASSAFSKSQYV